MIQFLGVLLPLGYVATLLLHGMAFGGPKAPKVYRLRRGATCGLLLMHGSFLWLLGERLGHLPVSGPWLTVSCSAFSLLLLYMLLRAITRTPPSTGLPVLALGAFLQFVASAGIDFDPSGAAREQSPFFVFHAVAAILAVVAMVLSGLYGLLYVLLLKSIRDRRFGAFFRRMPDLGQLASLNRAAAGLGFILLTLGLNVGIWWAHTGAVENLDYLSYEVWPALVLWVTFGLVSVSGWLRLINARNAAWVSVIASGLVLLTTIILFLPISGIHGQTG